MSCHNEKNGIWRVNQLWKEVLSTAISFIYSLQLLFYKEVGITNSIITSRKNRSNIVSLNDGIGWENSPRRLISAERDGLASDKELYNEEPYFHAMISKSCSLTELISRLKYPGKESSCVMKLAVMVWLRSKAVIPELCNTSSAGNIFVTVLLVRVIWSTWSAAAHASKHLWKISEVSISCSVSGSFFLARHTHSNTVWYNIK